MRRSNTAYVIGGGPSLAGFDFARLTGADKIGANKAAWLAATDIFVTVDRNFHNQNQEAIGAFAGTAYVAVPDRIASLPNVTYWSHLPGAQFSMQPGALAGSNSGFAALNLAFLLGYTEIALLGFDFQWDGNKSHFHEGYTRQNKQTDRFLGQWAHAFDLVQPILLAHDVRVTNFTGPRGSRVTAFPTLPLEELL